MAKPFSDFLRMHVPTSLRETPSISCMHCLWQLLKNQWSVVVLIYDIRLIKVFFVCLCVFLVPQTRRETQIQKKDLFHFALMLIRYRRKIFCSFLREWNFAPKLIYLVGNGSNLFFIPLPSSFRRSYVGVVVVTSIYRHSRRKIWFHSRSIFSLISTDAPATAEPPAVGVPWLNKLMSFSQLDLQFTRGLLKGRKCYQSWSGSEAVKFLPPIVSSLDIFCRWLIVIIFFSLRRG